MKSRINNFILFIFIMIILSSCSKPLVSSEPLILEEKEKLIVYTSHKEEVYGPIVDEFQARTGIWVQVITGGTNELLEQISYESKNVVADIMFGGGVDSLDSYSKYFASYLYEDKEVLDQKYYSNENKWTVFSQLPIVIIYNNKLVYELEVPKGWASLLEDRWKGKIAYADPNNSGSSYTILNTIMQVMGRDDWDSIKKFYNALDGKVLSGSGDVLNEVSSGTKLIGITLEETALKKIASGGDISIIYPIEGTSVVPDGAAMVLNSPHKENAKLFMEFILGQDVQKMLIEQNFRRSVRKDISYPNSWINNEIKLIDYDLSWAIKNRNEIMKYWNKLMF